MGKNNIFNKLKYNYYGKIVSPAIFNKNTVYMCRVGHHKIFTMEPIGVLRCAKQGFVTEYGLFVDRYLALKIARYFDQVGNKYNPVDQLLSEDLKYNNLVIKKYKRKYSYRERNI